GGETPTAYKINFSDYLSTLASLSTQVEYLKELESQYIQYPLYEYQFNASGIESWLRSHCDFYAEGVCKINDGKFEGNKEYLKAFLSSTQKVLIVLEILQELSVETNSVVNFTSSTVVMKDGISISPFTLFDTGHDIAVYGGAGAGKTTTLQMYVEDIIDKGLNNVIYLPLNRLINKKSVYFSVEAESAFSYKQILSLILLSKNIDDTDDSMNDMEIALRDKDSLRLVIDGLDEAYNKVPFILDSINEFKDKYPFIQLIVSSRDCVSFISKINFLGVTLLPFTTEQLYHFIKSWFAEDVEEAQGLIMDIDCGDLKEIVKTPLLATLLCILKKRRIDTPSTEMEIFTRRLKLLCGEYDNYKTIKRSRSDSMQLEKAAMKLAFHLHSRNKRSDSIESMVTYLAYDNTFGYPEDVCLLLVEELINPCNILHLDPLTKNYSFGHLRFQEHLAALELKENRGRDILPLLNKDWWSGTLCLYAQACDFSGLIEDYYRYYGEVNSALKIFKDMVSHRPLRARSNLLLLIQQYERTERLEGYTVEEDDYFDDSWRYPPI
ncbi:TPA: NACHT domain-containing NTPase, partial [Enterobacter cloacae]